MRTERILTAFVSSPGDVLEERNALEAVVRELNLTWSRTLGLRIELIRWETETFPDVGLDPQSVINRQLPEDYDIFIGVLWTRFGTPTPRAGSGTEEEFNAAYARHQAKSLLHLMIYLKDQPIAPFTDIDIAQFAKVKAFASSLGSKGALYSKFRSIDEFQTQARIHLSRIIQKLEAGAPEPAATPSVSSIPLQPDSSVDAAAASASDFEEPGLIELLETGLEALHSLTESQSRMSESLDSLRLRAEQGALEMKRHNESDPNNMAAAKRIIGGTAEAMEKYVARMNVELPIFSDALQVAFTATGKIGALSAEFWPTDKAKLTALLEQTTTFSASLSGTHEATLSLRDTIARTPRMTTQLNRARRRTVAALDQLAEELATGQRLATQTEELLKNLVEGPN